MQRRTYSLFFACGIEPLQPAVLCYHEVKDMIMNYNQAIWRKSTHGFISLLVGFLLLCAHSVTPAHADILIDDFEDVSDWIGLDLDTEIVHNGTAAGRWDDQGSKGDIRQHFILKTFLSPTSGTAMPIDASGMKTVNFWMYSAVANDAQIELIFNSDNAATPDGGDYYRYRIYVDWSGWRYFSIPLNKFIIARTPVGWSNIDSVALHAYGWGHYPLPDTMLVLDDMRLATGIISSIDKTAEFIGEDYVYSFNINLENRLGTDQVFNFQLLPSTNYSLNAQLLSPSQLIIPNGATAQVQARVTLPAAQITPATSLMRHELPLQISAADGSADGINLETTVPLPSRAHPRTLLDTSDFQRIYEWIGEEIWALSARNTIVAKADVWPNKYLKDYAITDWLPLPDAGQWSMWYFCPVHNNITLKYDAATKSHIDPVYNDVYTNNRRLDEVIYGRMHSELAGYARDLGLAYQLTGNLRYAQSAAQILLAYADRYLGYPLHDIYGGTNPSSARVMAQVLDEAVWLIPVAWAYDLVAGSGALTDTQKLHIQKNLLRPARDVLNWFGAANQQSWSNAAIAAVGFALEDWGYVADALVGSNGFEKQMRDEINADGVWKEGSWAYHFYALEPLIKVAEMATRAGHDLYSGNTPLRGMFEAPMNFAMPNWVLPPVGDGLSTNGFNLVSSAGLLEPAYNRYGSGPYDGILSLQTSRRNDALFWGARTLPTNMPAQLESLLLPASGLAVLRAGQGSTANYVAMRYGIATSRDQPDKLSIASYARGGVMSVDPGNINYGSPLSGQWYKQTVAHSTVVLDTTSQTTQNADGALLRFIGLPALSMVAGDAGPVYANANLRRTLVQSEDYLLDRFQVRTTSGPARQIDWVYHNNGAITTPLVTLPYSQLPTANGYQHMSNVTAAKTNTAWQASFNVTGPEARALHVHMLGEDGTTMVIGNGLNADVPFVMARRLSADTTFVTLLEPTVGPSVVTAFEALATNAAPTDAAVAVSIASNTYTDRLLALTAGSGGTQRSFGDASCDGTLCLIRSNTSAQLTRLIIADGQRLDQACGNAGCTMLLQSDAVLAQAQIDIDRVSNQIRITSKDAIDNALWVYFPEGNDSTQLIVNGLNSVSTQLGDYRTLNVPVADIALSGTGSPGPVTVGEDINYVFTITNYGPNTASSVTLTDTLSAGARFVSAEPATRCSGTNSVICNLGSLTAGAQTVVNLVAKATAAGALTNNARISAVERDPAVGNNSASTITQVNPPPSCLGTTSDYIYSINGELIQRTVNGKVALAGVTLNLSGPNNCVASISTNVYGKYTLGKLAIGTYTLIPSKDGCSSFSPSAPVFSVTRNTKQNFTGQCP